MKLIYCFIHEKRIEKDDIRFYAKMFIYAKVVRITAYLTKKTL